MATAQKLALGQSSALTVRKTNHESVRWLHSKIRVESLKELHLFATQCGSRYNDVLPLESPA
jgi:hypothetical protein